MGVFDNMRSFLDERLLDKYLNENTSIQLLKANIINNVFSIYNYLGSDDKKILTGMLQNTINDMLIEKIMGNGRTGKRFNSGELRFLEKSIFNHIRDSNYIENEYINRELPKKIANDIINQYNLNTNILKGKPSEFINDITSAVVHNGFYKFYNKKNSKPKMNHEILRNACLLNIIINTDSSKYGIDTISMFNQIMNEKQFSLEDEKNISDALSMSEISSTLRNKILEAVLFSKNMSGSEIALFAEQSVKRGYSAYSLLQIYSSISKCNQRDLHERKEEINQYLANGEESNMTWLSNKEKRDTANELLFSNHYNPELAFKLGAAASGYSTEELSYISKQTSLYEASAIGLSYNIPLKAINDLEHICANHDCNFMLVRCFKDIKDGRTIDSDLGKIRAMLELNKNLLDKNPNNIEYKKEVEILINDLERRVKKEQLGIDSLNKLTDFSYNELSEYKEYLEYRLNTNYCFRIKDNVSVPDILKSDLMKATKDALYSKVSESKIYEILKSPLKAAEIIESLNKEILSLQMEKVETSRRKVIINFTAQNDRIQQPVNYKIKDIQDKYFVDSVGGR